MFQAVSRKDHPVDAALCGAMGEVRGPASSEGRRSSINNRRTTFTRKLWVPVPVPGARFGAQRLTVGQPSQL